jgi:hypothetical protein
MRQWFNLSDPAAEEALYDSLAMRRFVGIDLGRDPVPDETTLAAPQAHEEHEHARTAGRGDSKANAHRAHLSERGELPAAGA